MDCQHQNLRGSVRHLTEGAIPLVFPVYPIQRSKRLSLFSLLLASSSVVVWGHSSTAAPLRRQPDQVAPHIADALPPPIEPHIVYDSSDKQEPYFPFLRAEDPKASISIGSTTYGYIVNSQQVHESESLKILPRQKKRNLGYGSNDMVRLLEATGKRLYKLRKRTFWIGNVGRRGGGDIIYSVSHNSGRDADVAFCYRDGKGRPLEPPDLVPLNNNGYSSNYLFRFDPACTWDIVESLLIFPETNIQHIFISKPLKAQLMAYAARMNKPAALVKKVNAVVHQPTDSAPHNDHLHVRIYCNLQDTKGGCIQTGVVHPWVRTFQKERDSYVKQLLTHLDDKESQERRRALQRLVVLNVRDQNQRILSKFQDKSFRVREAAAYALGAVGKPEDALSLVKLYHTEDTPEVKIAILDSLGELGTKEGGQLLRSVLSEQMALHNEPNSAILYQSAPCSPSSAALCDVANADQLSCSESSLALPFRDRCLKVVVDQQAANWAIWNSAVRAAGWSGRAEPIEALIPILNSENVELRTKAAISLRKLSNHSFEVNWEDPKLYVGIQQHAFKLWQQTQKQFVNHSRSSWVLYGFRQAGYHVKHLDRHDIWELVRAIADPKDHLSYNAQHTLEQISHHRPPTLEWSKRNSCHYWLRWFRSKKSKFLLEQVPDGLFKVCNSAENKLVE
jgi:murein endopeptidase